MENFIKDTYFESYGYDGVEFDGFLKRSPAKKQANVQRKQAKTAARTAKKTGKIERKAARNTAKIERKANRPRVLKVRAKIAEQEARTAAEIENTNADAEQNRNLIQQEADAASAANQDAQIDTTGFEPEKQVKVKNYLKRRNRGDIYDDRPEMLAAQFREERGREIAERYQEKVNWLDENAQANDPEWYEENYPEYDDIEEEILEEEENSFSFTGDSDNFLDPDTIAVATNIGKKAADLYRNKRFAQDKKAFGMTKAQWEAKQEAQRKALAEGTDTVSQLRGAAVQESTRQFIGRNPVVIVLGTILLAGAIYGLMQLNKK
jgi:hypothetical protein